MNAIDVLIEIPCFRCLFEETIKESYLHCNPNECQKLTDWLLMQVERDRKAEENISLATAHTQSTNVTMAKQKVKRPHTSCAH
jgi:hypothetical protein